MAKFAREILLETTEDDNGDWFTLRRVQGQETRAFGIFIVGTLDGGTVIIQGSPDEQVSAFTLRTYNDNQMTFSTNDYLAGPAVVPEIRARLTGSGSPDIKVYLIF